MSIELHPRVGKENKGSVKVVARSQGLRSKAWKGQGNIDKGSSINDVS